MPVDMSPLLPLSGFYLFSFAALGALFPFLPPLLSDRGLSATEVGRVMVVLPLCAMTLPTLWGALADALRARLWLLRLASLACAASVWLLLPARTTVAVTGAFLLLSATRVAQVPLADAVTCEALGGKNETFGRVRMWGSVGFALAVLGMGLADASRHPILLVSVTSALYLLCAAVTLPLRVPAVQRQPGVLRQTWNVLRRGWAFPLFLAGCAAHYAGHSTYDAYLGLHLRSLGHGDTVLGLAWCCGVCWEIAVMRLGPQILGDRAPGPLLMLCSVVAAARWALLSTVSGKVAVVAVQSLHGLTFGLWYLSLVRFVQDRAPERLRATCQSLAFTAIGLGTVIGYTGGSQLLERYGGATMYRGAAVAAVIAAALYGLVARSGRGSTTPKEAGLRRNPIIEKNDANSTC